MYQTIEETWSAALNQHKSPPRGQKERLPQHIHSPENMKNNIPTFLNKFITYHEASIQQSSQSVTVHPINHPTDAPDGHPFYPTPTPQHYTVSPSLPVYIQSPIIPSDPINFNWLLWFQYFTMILHPAYNKQYPQNYLPGTFLLTDYNSLPSISW